MDRSIHEEHIISGILSGTIRAEELAKLSPSNFIDSELGFILSASLAIERSGGRADVASVYQKIIIDNPDCWIGQAELEQLSERTTSATSVFNAMKHIRSDALRTALEERVVSILGSAANLTGPQLLQKIEHTISDLKLEFTEIKRGFKFLNELADKIQSIYEDMHKNVSYCIPTGFTRFDSTILDGFSRGDEHVIAGFTGHGKTALALKMARWQAKNGYKVGWVSREMSAFENIVRMQSSELELPRHFIRSGMPLTDKDQLVSHLQNFQLLPFSINTDTRDIGALKIEVRQMVREGLIDILYIDTIQLMSSEKRSSSGRRDLEVGDISTGLKEIAMENEIPVVSLSQFSRGALNASPFELMGFLKESSSIEQDASTISYIKIEKPEDGAWLKGKYRDASLMVLKNRNGMPFIPIPFRYRGEIFEFEEAL